MTTPQVPEPAKHAVSQTDHALPEGVVVTKRMNKIKVLVAAAFILVLTELLYSIRLEPLI